MKKQILIAILTVSFFQSFSKWTQSVTVFRCCAPDGVTCIPDKLYDNESTCNSVCSGHSRCVASLIAVSPVADKIVIPGALQMATPMADVVVKVPERTTQLTEIINEPQAITQVVPQTTTQLDASPVKLTVAPPGSANPITSAAIVGTAAVESLNPAQAPR